MNKQTIKLFGKELILSERKVIDGLALQQFDKGTMFKTDSLLQFQRAKILSDGLKQNVELLKWYQVFRKRKLSKLLTPEYLMSQLRKSELKSLSEDVLILEGVDPQEFKKKRLTGNTTLRRKLTMKELQL